jgi:hypothetical protein
MFAGYVPAWLLFPNAVGHVQRVTGCTPQQASDGLVAALRDGAIASRFADTGASIDPQKWFAPVVWLEGEPLLSEPGDAPIGGRSRPVELRRGDIENIWPGDITRTVEPAPTERLTLPEQVSLLARVMPEDRARARIEKAFRFREVSYDPEFAVSYDDARIDWQSGMVVLRRVPRQPFTPTLSAAEFDRHFRASRGQPSSAEPQPIVAKSKTIEPRKEHPGSLGEDATTHSGFPGRPGKAKHLIEDEFRRRMKAEESLPNLGDEAAALLAWLVKAHPTVSRPTRGTIENNIRDNHRRWTANREANPR